MSEQYELEKTIWSEADFERMGWHDSRVHALGFLPDRFEFALDVDHTFQWIEPRSGETYFSLRVAPATLVFDLQTSAGCEILDVARSEPRRIRNAEYIEWLWKFECAEGEINFRATGFKQYIRSAPRLGNKQSLSLNERGRFSFSREYSDKSRVQQRGDI
jgi:hypothetical protein